MGEKFGEKDGGKAEGEKGMEALMGGVGEEERRKCGGKNEGKGKRRKG